MKQINIVLHQPQIPQNTGNIARTCAVTGARLHLIGPMGFAIDDAKLKRAGLDYWHMLDIRHYDGLEDFVAQNSGAFYFFTTKGTRPHSEFAYPDNPYIFFGREDAGLPEALLKSHPASCLRIPMLQGARSLNLSNSVAIVTFEILRQWGYPGLSVSGSLGKEE